MLGGGGTYDKACLRGVGERVVGWLGDCVLGMIFSGKVFRGGCGGRMGSVLKIPNAGVMRRSDAGMGMACQ